MKKTFCDICGEEFTKEDHSALYIVDKKRKAVIALELLPNKGYRGADACNECAKDIMNNGDIMLETKMEAVRSTWS